MKLVAKVRHKYKHAAATQLMPSCAIATLKQGALNKLKVVLTGVGVKTALKGKFSVNMMIHMVITTAMITKVETVVRHRLPDMPYWH